MNSRISCFATLAIAALANTALSMEFVTVGNAGNIADTTGKGAVNHVFRIGKYEVTNAQYAEFLNAKASRSDPRGLFAYLNESIFSNTSQGIITYTVLPGLANRPVENVSWFDAARFCNWLANGKGDADMETGSYDLMGATTGIINVNPGAKVWIPTEDEWYKAAFYNGTTGTYSLYPTGRNSITTADANYLNGNGTTDVGSYFSSPSHYGTFDQGGNVQEWNDSISGTKRGMRGGHFRSPDFVLKTTGGGFSNPDFEFHLHGFRVAAAPAGPYFDWVSINHPSLTGNDALPGSDPDGDGLNNLGEFAFGSDPTSGASDGRLIGKFASVNGSQAFTITLPARNGTLFTNGAPATSAAIDGIIYQIESGAGLDAWTIPVETITGPDATAIQSTLPPLPPGYTYHSFRLNTPPNSPRAFARARISGDGGGA